MKVGITEVAERAMVSEATVSRVINRRQGVSCRTREAVEQAMADLGYERQTRGQLVAVITELVSNPFFADVAERIESMVARPARSEDGAVPVLPGRGAGVGLRDLARRPGRGGRRVPLGQQHPGGRGPFGVRTAALAPDPVRRDQRPVRGGERGTGLSTDDLLAAELAVDHLYRLGHRRIGMASGPVGNRPADLRVSGFVASLGRRGVAEPEQWVVRQSYTVEGGQSAAISLLARGATAIVAASDYMALGAIRGARRQGYDVPGDVSVVGYDGSMIMDFVDPRSPPSASPPTAWPRRRAAASSPWSATGTSPWGTPLRPRAGDPREHGGTEGVRWRRA